MTGDGQLATTRPGVELVFVWAFIGIRAFDLLQAAIAITAGSLRRSTEPPLDVGLLIAVACESLVLGWWLLRRRSLLPFRWPMTGDVALSVCVIALVPLYVAPAARINTWTMWSYAVTLSTVVLLAAGLDHALPVFAGAGALAVSYAAVTALPASDTAAARMTAIVNALAYLGFALLAFVVARFIRNLAIAADSARQRVAELEQERSRAIVHQMLSFLQLDRFAAASEGDRALMVAQARAKHRQMRSFVDGTGGSADLRACVDGILELHPALGVRPVVQIEPPLRLRAAALDQLALALDTALVNAEQHAPGACVTVEVRSEADHVLVLVRDDGPGFDSQEQPVRFGIGHILGDQLREIGGRGEVRSVRGEGTQVRIMVPRELQA